jgi:predicted nicotinamide N-methyase
VAVAPESLGGKWLRVPGMTDLSGTGASRAAERAKVQAARAAERAARLAEATAAEAEEGGGFFNADLFTSNVGFEEQTLAFGDALRVRLRFIHASNQHVDRFVSRVVWPSASELCAYLAARPELVLGKRVLELGSGTGLCGLAVALLGARQVVLTDYNDPAMELLADNVALNGMQERCTCRKLTWGDREGARALAVEAGGLFDLVVGTDVVYEPACIRPLLSSAAHLLRPDGLFYLANCTIRYGGLESRVKATAKELGMHETVLPSIVGHDGRVDLSTFRPPSGESASQSA